MNRNDYRLDAYRKAAASDKQKDTTKTESVSSAVRRSADPGHEPLVHKAMFEHVNSQVEQILSQKKENDDATKQAEFAAETGTWYGKKRPVTDDDVRKATDALKSGGL